MKLTQAAIAKLKLPSGKTDFIAWDDELPGFGLRIREGGSRALVVQYKLGAKTRRMTLGSSLDAARKNAKMILARVRLGEDPQSDRVMAKATAPRTFKSVAEAFLAFQATRLAPGSLYSTRLYLLDYCRRLHGLQVSAISRADVAGILTAIAKSSGAVSADRARSALSSMFGWAIKDGLCESNPVDATNTFAGKRERDRVLADAEIAAIWSALPDNDYGTIVALLFYTACRADEIGGLRWSELNVADRLVTLPKERTKNRRAYDLPLSEPAFALLMLNQQRGDRDLVFGRRAGGFQGWSKAKLELNAALDIKDAWQLRDIRRTVATGMAGIGVQPHIVEACLNHVSGSKAGVAGIYNRATYAPEKRAAFEQWASYISMLLAQASGANVIPMPRPVA